MRSVSLARVVLPATATVLVACGTEHGALPLQPMAQSFAHSGWSEPVNAGAPVNSASTEQNTALSKDGLTLYIQSNRLGGLGGNDLWVAQRSSLDSPWEEPVHLGDIINSTGADGGPALSLDEHYLFFHTDRAGGLGDRDIWVSYRADPTNDFGWEAPVNLGPLVNTPDAELSPAIVTGPGGHQLYFQRGPQQLFGIDIYQAPVSHSGEPQGSAEVVAELSLPNVNDGSPNPRQDGREIIFASTRLGGGGGLFVATRQGPNDVWGEPVSLGGSLSANANGPRVSSDGRTMMFFSTRLGGVGGFDIWVTTRTPSGN